VLAGVHGDEWEGTLAAGALCAAPPALSSGALHIVPVCNEAARAAGARRNPLDGLDLARCLPGDPGGQPTERVAALVAELLTHVDVLIDLHTGGLHYDMPLLAGCLDDNTPSGQRAVELARAFGLPRVWLHDRYAPGRTVTHVAANGGTALYVESTGGPVADRDTAHRYELGVRRVLGCLGMSDVPAGPSPTAQVVLRGGGDFDRDVVRAAQAGFFWPQAIAGAVLEPGACVGWVEGERGNVIQRVDAPPVRAMLVMVRRTTAVAGGDVLVSYAECDQ
jgi:hypothetical protein